MSVALLLDALASAHAVLAAGPDSPELGEAADDEIMGALQRVSALRRLVDSRAALVAAEISRRSARDLGHAGLAQRLGHRTPEELVRVTTGSSRHDARIAVRAGGMLANAGDAGGPGIPTWAQALAEPARRGELSIAALEAIVSGLGVETDSVSAAALEGATLGILTDIAILDVDRLHRRARELRDELDVAGIAERERRQRDERSLRLVRGNDGMTRATWMLDPESAAVIIDLYDRATSPRRGGPTFLSGRDADLADRIQADDRTPEQYASDAFLELLRSGADGDASMLLSTGAPAVRVVVTAADLASGTGRGDLEHPTAVISLPTVQRLLCTGAHTPVLVQSTGQPLDVGRTQRLFTQRQRIALAVRDGGCRWAGCERPPSWCEAHHIEPWSSSRGRTDVADGMLLCRHHHLLVHNNGWRIERHRGPDGVDEYVAQPPPSPNSPSEPIPLPASTSVVRRALHRLAVA